MIGIIGAGTMGKGIAIEFARFGHKVLLISAQRHLDSEELFKEVKKVADKYDYKNENEILSNIITTNSFVDISNCKLVIEALSEDIDIKRTILMKTIEMVSNDTIMATNTSSLSIKEIFNGIYPLKKVVGIHFFNPVQIMKLVEISYLEETETSVLETTKKLIIDIEKESVLVKNSPGFIVNRLLIPMINEASRLVDEGIASIEDIDKAMKYGANHPMGPLKLSDLIGNDVVCKILNSLQSTNGNIIITNTLVTMVDNNQLGRKTKIGFYKYDEKPTK